MDKEETLRILQTVSQGNCPLSVGVRVIQLYCLEMGKDPNLTLKFLNTIIFMAGREIYAIAFQTALDYYRDKHGIYTLYSAPDSTGRRRIIKFV